MDLINFARPLAAVLFVILLAASSPAQCREIYPLTVVDKQPVTKDHAGPRVGLALGGGGTRGACHIGVIKVLEEEGVPIDYITGNSAGAIVGGLYAAGVPIKKIKQLVDDKAIYRAYLTIPMTLRLALVPVTMVPRLLGIHPYAGLYRGNKFAAFINKCLPPQRQNVENTIIPFAVVTTDVLTGQAYVISKGPLGKAMQASAAIPGIRKPVEWQGRLLEDGVLAANLPVPQARDMGAGIVICVNSDGPVKPVEEKAFRGMKFSKNRISNLILKKLDQVESKGADIVIVPDVADIDLISPKLSDAQKAIAEGEKAARRAMPQIRRLLHLYGNNLAESERP